MSRYVEWQSQTDGTRIALELHVCDGCRGTILTRSLPTIPWFGKEIHKLEDPRGSADNPQREIVLVRVSPSDGESPASTYHFCSLTCALAYFRDDGTVDDRRDVIQIEGSVESFSQLPIDSQAVFVNLDENTSRSIEKQDELARGKTGEDPTILYFRDSEEHTVARCEETANHYTNGEIYRNGEWVDVPFVADVVMRCRQITRDEAESKIGKDALEIPIHRRPST